MNDENLRPHAADLMKLKWIKEAKEAEQNNSDIELEKEMLKNM